MEKALTFHAPAVLYEFRSLTGRSMGTDSAGWRMGNPEADPVHVHKVLTLAINACIEPRQSLSLPESIGWVSLRVNGMVKAWNHGCFIDLPI
jgi:hypothetical protein